MNRRLAILICAVACAGCAAAQAATNKPIAHVRVALVAERSALVPGRRNWVGLHLIHDPHWHTYWVNPGDSGLPTKLDWRLPAGIRAGDIAWPAPERFEAGGLHTFGYAGDVILPVPLGIDRDVGRGRGARLVVEARWLACREECIPGKATLKLVLPVASGARPNRRLRKWFAAAHAAQPRADTWSGRARVVGDRVMVALEGANLPRADHLDALVIQNQVVGYAPPQVNASEGELELSFPRSEYLTAPPPALELVLVEQRRPPVLAHSVTVPFSATTEPAADSEERTP
jgi:DsbC/DsbD-like thiol-disulfide interchange protein